MVEIQIRGIKTYKPTLSGLFFLFTATEVQRRSSQVKTLQPRMYHFSMNLSNSFLICWYTWPPGGVGRSQICTNARNFFLLVLNPVLNNFTGYLNFCHLRNSEWSCPICFHHTSLTWFRNHPFSWTMELWSLTCFQTPLRWHCSKEQSFQSLLLFPVLCLHPFLVLACCKLYQNNPTKMINFVSDQFPHWVAEQLRKHQKGEAFRGDRE